jgi:archaellum component FlaC
MSPPKNTIDTVAKDVENIKDDVKEVKGDVKELNSKIDTFYLTIKQFRAEFNPVRDKLDDFLTKEVFEAEFKPIRNIIYGMVGSILLIVLTAIVYLVIKGGA